MVIDDSVINRAVKDVDDLDERIERVEREVYRRWEMYLNERLKDREQQAALVQEIGMLKAKCSIFGAVGGLLGALSLFLINAVGGK